MSGIIGQVGARSGVLGSTTDSTQLDYEEGTFQPTIGFNSGGSSNVGTNNDGITGHYVKIGRQVSFVISIFNQSLSGSSLNHYIHGLPFTNGGKRSTTSHPLYVSCFDSNPVVGLIQYSSTDIEFLQQGATTWGASAFIAGTQRYLHVHGVYFTDY